VAEKIRNWNITRQKVDFSAIYISHIRPELCRSEAPGPSVSTSLSWRYLELEGVGSKSVHWPTVPVKNASVSALRVRSGRTKEISQANGENTEARSTSDGCGRGN
jgi:hypothetical protein